MKIERFSGGKLFLKMGTRERRVFLGLLKLYPVVPPAHHKISRGGKLPDADSTQRLLDEALAEQRADNKKQLQTFLADPTRIQQRKDGTRLIVTAGEAEWLLQILNDIRVGSWVLLGAPDDILFTVKLGNARYAWAMEMAGFFQGEFLEALESGADPALEQS